MPRYLALLSVALSLASTTLAYSLGPDDAAFYCTNKEQCCRPITAKDNGGRFTVDEGKCVARGGACPAGSELAGQMCGIFPVSTPPPCQNGCCIQYAEVDYSARNIGLLLPGVEYMCLAAKGASCDIYGKGAQQFEAANCANNIPNMKQRPQPVCNTNQYCAREFATFQSTGDFYPGLKTQCVDAGKGAPDGYAGSSDTDCNVNYPNWIQAPPAPQPKNCDAGHYACIEFPTISMTGVMPGINTTCQATGQGCPVNFRGYGLTSFNKIWPNKDPLPAPKDCGANEKCCIKAP